MIVVAFLFGMMSGLGVALVITLRKAPQQERLPCAIDGHLFIDRRGVIVEDFHPCDKICIHCCKLDLAGARARKAVAELRDQTHAKGRPS